MLLLFDALSILDPTSIYEVESRGLMLASLPEACTELIRTRSAPVSNVKIKQAGHCKHNLHPGTPQTEVICPTCKINQRLKDLKDMTYLWTSRLHLKDEKQDLRSKILYLRTSRAWHTERASTFKYIMFLEIWTEREEKWELENPDMLQWEGVESARKALVIVKKDLPCHPCPQPLEDMSITTRTKKESTKGVRFEADVSERPTRQREAFWRISIRYSPGRWEAPHGTRWMDTSFQSDSRYGRDDNEWETDTDEDDDNTVS